MYNQFSDAYPKPELKKPEYVEKNYVYSSDIGDLEHFNHHLMSYKIVIVKAWSPTCQPCKHAGQKIEDLGKQLKQYIDYKYIVFLNDNVTDPNSLHKTRLQVVPTFFIYFKGKLESVFTGLEFNEFQDKIVELLNKDNE